MGSDTIDVDAPDAEQTQSAATFHYFCKLAPELRIKIWNAALPNARTIEITGDVLETLSDTARLVNLPKPPAIRGVCHEAWEITQKNWVHSLGLRYEEFGENFPGFWFDPDTDIILDWKRWNREFENGQFFERVRNLAICSRDVSLEENFDRVLDSFWDLLPNIRRLIIIIFDDVGLDGEEGLIPELQPIDDDSIIASKDSGDTWLDWNYFPKDDEVMWVMSKEYLEGRLKEIAGSDKQRSLKIEGVELILHRIRDATENYGRI
ncbi:hypothetical protein CGCA056_v000423 [Colletotrichum aenigma]|uniref:uncharacterized protein n=1 Tax=Colletotrichum aenigma TaxID=1215731 RepID=UPI0018731143|nr:uncharacterized protein CGCA056_v000423 [Colletotrichum aenigma]KAF5527557.1 hypothetical protein CGCA056_v000423 [Colletotrichum aenigma]